MKNSFLLQLYPIDIAIMYDNINSIWESFLLL